MIVEAQKDYEQCSSGQFNGTVIDVVDLGPVDTAFGKKVKLRIIWVLGLIGGKGAFAVDSEGNPFRAMRQVTASINEKSKLTELVKGVTGQAPPAPFDSEILMNRSNKLFIETEKDPKTGKMYANIKYITALDQGEIPPGTPPGFVRAKDRQANNFPRSAAPAVAPPPAQPVQTQAVAQAAPVQANPVPAAPQATAAPQPVSGAPVVDASF